MKVEPAAQLRLLELQALDTEVRQLAHRRASLPELAQLARCIERSGTLRNHTAELTARAAELDTAVSQLETDVETVASRAARDETRLAAGGIPSKELESLQHEVISLARRRSSLEDELLEVMEQRESLQADLDLAARDRRDLDADVLALTHARDQAFADIDAQSAARSQMRQQIAAQLPTALLALYDKVSAANGGVGAAPLEHRRCGGCRIELAGNELTRARNAAGDDVLRCENCRRILIRTPESGL